MRKMFAQWLFCMGHIDWEGTKWRLWETRNILTLDLAHWLHGYTYIHIDMYIHIGRYVYPWNNTLKICALYCMLYTKKKERGSGCGVAIASRSLLNGHIV